MPYITEKRRKELANEHYTACEAGELNFKITAEIIKFIELLGVNYRRINDVIGALEGAKAEFQRRVVAPYEDKKIAENGDLPWPSV